MIAKLTIDAIRKRAAKFSKDFADASYEMGEAQTLSVGYSIAITDN